MVRLFFVALGALLVYALASSVSAQVAGVDDGKLPKDKRTDAKLYLTAEQAYELARQDPKVVLIDVRAQAEVAFLGLPQIAARNVPYMQLDPDYSFDAAKGEYKLVLNPDFAAAVKALLDERSQDRNSRIVLICRSGTRSAKAANLLSGSGYSHVYSVVDGFEGDKDKAGRRTIGGWRNVGLPWSYKIIPAQAYKSPSF
jgi:rhodanese-related sulfurtransferase